MMSKDYWRNYLSSLLWKSSWEKKWRTIGWRKGKYGFPSFEKFVSQFNIYKNRNIRSVRAYDDKFRRLHRLFVNSRYLSVYWTGTRLFRNKRFCPSLFLNRMFNVKRLWTRYGTSECPLGWDSNVSWSLPKTLESNFFFFSFLCI